MKNKSIKNILFYIALLPYMILLFICVFYAIIGYGYYLGNTAYGFVAIGNFLGDFFGNVTELYFNPITLCIIILWIGYQIYFFISFKSDKKEKSIYTKEGNEITSKKINLKRILFFISIYVGLYILHQVYLHFSLALIQEEDYLTEQWNMG